MGIIISDFKFRWPNDIIPFEFDDNAFPISSANRATIQSAIEHWNRSTIVRLRPRRNERDYVRFTAANGSCSSAIGRQGGRQNIGCDLMTFGTGSIIHEIGHAVGLFHEHTRQDRDEFVTIEFNNIKDKDKDNFEKKNKEANDVGPYDYGSIMHYGETSTNFAINTAQNTITAPESIGQRSALSNVDVATVEESYNLPNERFFAIWHQSDHPEIQVYGWTYQRYRAKYDALWPQGWRLKELSPYVINGQVRYTAVWTKSTRSEIQVYGWEYKDYRAKYDELWPQGWRLSIIKPYVHNGQVRYTAVWTKSTRSEIQVYGWEYKDYRAKYDELWPQGWRLLRLQPYVFQGKVRYTAVWQRSRRSEIQLYDVTYQDFRKKYDQLWRLGWRLQMLQPYRNGSRTRYTAVWHHRPKRGELQAYNLKYASYRAIYDEKWPENWRLHKLIVI